MFSVTGRIKVIKQPKGGYLSPKLFKVIERSSDDNLSLINVPENISPSLVGLAVDYLTRAILNNNPMEAFKISIIGAKIIKEEKQAIEKAKSVKDLSKQSIIFSCQLAGYDVCYMAGPAHYKPVEDILPDNNTCKNIEKMVKNSIKFFEDYGPIVKEGFNFQGGYTKIVTTGDGDFITADTLWDFKVSKRPLTKQHTLQLLMYYIMGMHSIHKDLHVIKKLGIFNPRLNKVYLLDISENILDETIKEVEKNVICY